jgi:transcription initiation factor IIE alpha subunit
LAETIKRVAKLLRIPFEGEWFSQLFECGNCHMKFMLDGGHTPNFCPNCGANLQQECED